MLAQIFWGSLVLGICTMVHLIVLMGWVKSLRWFQASSAALFIKKSQVIVIASALVGIILAHTLQVWMWAASLIALGALESFSDAIYFSIVTYTTVGYGDFTLGPDFRIFGAMASVTCLLGFGISTAFLVGLLEKMFSSALVRS